MNYKGVIKRQSFIITVSIISMALVLIGSSFALFRDTQKSTSDQVVQSGTLQISYLGSSNAPINNTTIVPSDDSSAYTIKIENTGSLAMDYDLVIYTGSDNQIDHSLIMVKLDDNVAIPLSSISLRTPATQDVTTPNLIRYIITSGTLSESTGNNTNKTHTLKVWIDEEADESIQNSKIQVLAEVQGRVSGTSR